MSIRDSYDVIIIGAGPAGIFAALEFHKISPRLSVLIIDKGRRIDKRSCPARLSGVCVHCDPCAIMSGWSGAGAFSDGKLTLSEEVGGQLTDYLPAKEVRELIGYCDDIYKSYGASPVVHGTATQEIERIAYECQKHNIQLITNPIRHLGTDGALRVLTGMYETIAASEQVDFAELTQAEDLLVDGGRVVGVRMRTRVGPSHGEASRDVAARSVIATWGSSKPSMTAPSSVAHAPVEVASRT